MGFEIMAKSEGEIARAPGETAVNGKGDAWYIKEAILDELGEIVFEQLCEAIGGAEIMIPSRDTVLTDGHFIVHAIGLENAKILASAVGPAKYYVPKPFRPAPDKSEMLRDFIAKGMSHLQISRELGCSERHVRRLMQQNGLTNPNVRKLPTSRNPVLISHTQFTKGPLGHPDRGLTPLKAVSGAEGADQRKTRPSALKNGLGGDD